METIYTIICLLLYSVGSLATRLKYIGCYADYTFDRDFPVQLSLNSTAECVEICKNLGHHFIGLQESTCHCGVKYGFYGIANGCKTLCHDAEHLLCGNTLANSVYRIIRDKYKYKATVMATHSPRNIAQNATATVMEATCMQHCLQHCSRQPNCYAFIWKKQRLETQRCKLLSTDADVSPQVIQPGSTLYTLAQETATTTLKIKSSPVQVLD